MDNLSQLFIKYSDDIKNRVVFCKVCGTKAKKQLLFRSVKDAGCGLKGRNCGLQERNASCMPEQSSEGHDYNCYQCPHIDKNWHKMAEDIRREIMSTKDANVLKILQGDIRQICLSNLSKKKRP